MEKINALKRAILLLVVLLVAVPMTLQAQTAVQLGIVENPSDSIEVRFLLVIFFIVSSEQVSRYLFAGIKGGIESFATMVGETWPLIQ